MRRQFVQAAVPSAGLIVIASLLVGFTMQEEASPQEPERVGNDTCLACHEVEAGFTHTPHVTVECESCHGPGGAHVESGGEDLSVSFRQRTAEWGIEQCLSCHGREDHISGFLRSAHGLNQVACATCHEVHPERVNFGLLRSAENQLCVSCHRSTGAEFRKPFHHPVLEGGMSCTNCHNPHIEEQTPMRSLALGNSENCISCHSEKRGPFVFEHAPMKINDCQTCHEPHASINPRMLRRTQVHQLCLECHSATVSVAGSQPPSFHDLRSGRFQNCTICHREIHGSNASPLFLR